MLLKRLAFLFIVLFAASKLSSQIFHEDFNSGTALSSWTLIDLDGRTPANNVSQYVNAWILKQDSSIADSCASSTSWYNPLGQADDWMVSPLINIGSSNILSWDAEAQDNRYPDGYEIRISTTTADTAGFNSHPPIFTIAAENPSWTRRSLNLQALGYANQSIYLAWRNNSNDQYILNIDNIKIDSISGSDASLLTAYDIVDEYAQTPLKYTDSLNLLAVIENVGADTLRNLKAIYDIYRNGNLVFRDSTIAISALAPTDTVLMPAPNAFKPTFAGSYHVVYYPKFNGVDVDLTNNFYVTDTLIVSDSTFAREFGQASGSLGIGVGIQGELGSIFNISQPDSLSSVSVYILNTNGQMTGQPISINVRSYNGSPSALLASSDTIIYNSTGASWVDFSFVRSGGFVPLVGGDFFIGVVESDSNLTMGTSARIHTRNANYIKFPGGITNGWNPLDAYNIFRALMIRPHFGPTNFTVGVKEEIALMEEELLVYPNPSIDGIYYLKSTQSNIQSATVRVLDLKGEIVYSTNGSQLKGEGFKINLSAQPSGIYFLQFENGTQSTIKKLVKH